MEITFITKQYLKEIYDKLTDEIKKSKYDNTYFWSRWDVVRTSNQMEKVIRISQETSFITYEETLSAVYDEKIVLNCKRGSKYIITYFEEEFDKYYKLDDVKKIMAGIVDFEKLEAMECDNGYIPDTSLEKLLKQKVILDKDRFLKIYTKFHKIYLLKDFNFKNMRVIDLVNIYYDLILNYYIFNDNIVCDEDIDLDDKVGKYL